MAMRLDHGADELTEVHDINVTPFIDVMLVLLIIFMVAAPLATVDIAVDLPSSTAQPQQRPDKPVYLTVKADLSARPRRRSGRPRAPAGALDAATNGNKDERIFLRADRSGRLWRRHAGDERAARGRLSEGRAGRAWKCGRRK